jgi:hypothetical protein
MANDQRPTFLKGGSSSPDVIIVYIEFKSAGNSRISL